MSVQITDGLGTGYRAGVDGENRVLVRSINENDDFHINQVYGTVWSVPFGPYDPAGANDYIFYLKNTGTQPLRVTDFRLSCTGAIGNAEVHAVTGTAASGSTLTPVNRNLGSTNTISGIVEGGTDITGLTTAGTIFRMDMDVVNKLYHLSTSSNIIIPKGSAIAILIDSATCVTTGIVSVVESPNLATLGNF